MMNIVACAAGLPRGVVLMDAGYGNNSELLEKPELPATGIVDQHIDPTEAGERGFDNRSGQRSVADVQPRRDATANALRGTGDNSDFAFDSDK
jgi:hypothetical protein